MNFFHLPRNKSFNIPYRFHDPAEEAKQERLNRVNEELGREREEASRPHYSGTMRGSFRASSKHSRYASKQKQKSNFRVIMIVAMLAFLAYWFLN